MRGANGGTPAAGAGAPSGDTPSTRAVRMDNAPGTGASRAEQTVVQSGDVIGLDSAAQRAGRQNGNNGNTAARNAGGNGASANRGVASGRGGRNGTATGDVPSAPVRARTALVFVQTAPGTFEPRVVRLGASNYDYSEVLSGLKEGETVALLAVASLQQRRDQQNDRFRNMNSGPVPGMQRAGGAGGGGARGSGGGR